jgi:hypothetical protein
MQHGPLLMLRLSEGLGLGAFMLLADVFSVEGYDPCAVCA